MSATREITLWCDDDECSEWMQFNDAQARGSVVRARKVARRLRWTYENGRDLCRLHATYIPKVKPDMTPRRTIQEIAQRA